LVSATGPLVDDVQAAADEATAVHQQDHRERAVAGRRVDPDAAGGVGTVAIRPVVGQAQTLAASDVQRQQRAV
jgi:hypothetical protein